MNEVYPNPYPRAPGADPYKGNRPPQAIPVLSIKDAKKALKLARKHEEERKREKNQARRQRKRRQQDKEAGRLALRAVAADTRPEAAQARVEAAKALSYNM